MAHRGVGGFFARQWRTYVGNALSRRDFRVQLRGNRSAILLGVYLFFLIGISLFVYDSASSRGTSLAGAQSELQSFYATIMGMVKFAALAIATASGATAIVMESQRRQLELVLMTSAPPKYLLVGKLISSFRYTWMVLILSLPVTAACVVLGGATWSAVLLSYLMISMHALFCAALGLAISCYVTKPTGAIGWAFTALLFLAFFTSTLTIGAAFSGMSGRASSVPFTVLLSPVASIVPDIMESTSIVLGRDMPNWILASLVILVLVRFLLHVGGFALSHKDARTVTKFRLDCLVHYGLAQYALGCTIGPSVTPIRSATRGGVVSSVGTPVPEYAPGLLTAWMAIAVLVTVVPVISSYGFDTFRIARPDGRFSLSAAFRGTPAGGLPYALLLTAVGGAAFALGMHFTGVDLAHEIVAGTGFAMCLAVAVWGATRWFASALSGMRNAATVAVGASALFLLGPLALFANAGNDFSTSGPSVWDLYILRPILLRADRIGLVFTHGGVLLLIGIVLFVLSERRLLRNLALPPKIIKTRNVQSAQS